MFASLHLALLERVFLKLNTRVVKFFLVNA